MKTRLLLKFSDGKSLVQNTDLTAARIMLDHPLFYTTLVYLDSNTENQQPIFAFPNYQDYGYGIFLLDDKSRDYVLKNIQNEKDDFLRTMMWGSLWDSVREGELAPKDYVELVIKNINVETDESTISTLLGRVFNRDELLSFRFATR